MEHKQVRLAQEMVLQEPDQVGCNYVRSEIPLLYVSKNGNKRYKQGILQISNVIGRLLETVPNKLEAMWNYLSQYILFLQNKLIPGNFNSRFDYSNF